MDTLPRNHNRAGVSISVEIRFFNTLTIYAPPGEQRCNIEVEAGTTVGDLITRFAVPKNKIFLALRNGRDITPGLYEGGNVNEDAVLDDGDVIAFSGPVPYSYGFGAPVV
jgi:hypothetical protein